MPIRLDVITSYAFSSPTCAAGEIDADGLKKCIKQFTEKFPLTEYDIKTLPYVLYYWHCMCNYRSDELGDISNSYKAIAKLINNFLNWLYNNVEELSEHLLELQILLWYQKLLSTRHFFEENLLTSVHSFCILNAKFDIK